MVTQAAAWQDAIGHSIGCAGAAGASLPAVWVHSVCSCALPAGHLLRHELCRADAAQPCLVLHSPANGGLVNSMLLPHTL
jgi:hypothetical protein